MANLHAFTPVKKVISRLPVSTDKTQVFNEVDFVSSFKWTYLIADNIQFTEKRPYSIKLPKPDSKTLVSWIEKIALAQQCATLFVEELALDEVNYKRIKQLCMDNQVTLVNLFQPNSTQTNVVQGPW
ncbi:hypothetical protein [Paraglaciecola sp. 2405UD69-4]|uniref:hypothetical protein n=1 Tax=Paraglaciecola sp. 2405UD69-4 TaxID=3391836 RepID=UPI0039C9DC54